MSKFKYICLVFILMYVAVSVIYKLGGVSNSIIISKTIMKQIIKDEPKTILLWTHFFSAKRWWLPADTVSESFFRNISCPVTNCIITTNTSYMKSVTEFDAIVFHSARKFYPVNKIPANRTASQYYVFGSLESPINTHHDLAKEDHFYNLTMSYRLGSDIKWRYAIVEDIETGERVAPALNPKWRNPIIKFRLDSKSEEMIRSKNKTAAWFVSHCQTQSRREKLVKELQKYVQVDIYGNCGKLRCPKSSKECDEKLDNQYKFYLSFENSLCIDYVTEKLFTKMNRNIVPIVFGGAQYYRFVPPHSYIDAEDFKTIKELANYLKFLEANPDEYRKYFWWKQFYTITRRIHDNFCELCEHLNNAERRHFSYANIRDWWHTHNCFPMPFNIKF